MAAAKVLDDFRWCLHRKMNMYIIYTHMYITPMYSRTVMLIIYLGGVHKVGHPIGFIILT